MPFTLNVFGLWYSAKLFKTRGWAVPTTWDDLLKLAPEMVKAGVAPMVYDGVDWDYPSWPLMSMIVKNGGNDVIVAIDQLEPNAWKHAAVLNAAKAIEEFRAKGYFLKGTEGLNHTQSQTEWALGKAAFIPCGGWLENESADVIPKDYEPSMVATPALPGDKMGAAALYASPGWSCFVPTKAKNQKFGLEFMRFMVSKEATQIFVRNTKSLTATRPEWAEGLAETPGLKSQIECLKMAGKELFTARWAWYGASYADPVGNAILELFKGSIKADEFVARAQKAADDYAKKPENKPRQRKTF